ncbi:MAG: hypothetical protein AAB893_00545 [Patescibacteria group bacterium]
MDAFLEEVRKIAYIDGPVQKHIDLSCAKGKKLALALGANEKIVEAGTLLMDCVISRAIKENRLAEHVTMCLGKTNELLSRSNLSTEDKENIRYCVLEHHGAKKFYSLESEICCNADCYRFASVEGFMYAVRYFREMEFSDLVTLLKNKLEEKWDAISLEQVRKELGPEYKVVKTLLSSLRVAP